VKSLYLCGQERRWDTMYKLNQNSVTRLADGASIPFANGNRDYEEYKQWLSEGNTPEPEFTQAELEAKVQMEAKAERLKQLEVLTVTTTNGNTFDANNQARLDMSNGIQVSEILNVTQTVWRMANDTEVLIQIAELKEALALALTEYARIKGIG